MLPILTKNFYQVGVNTWKEKTRDGWIDLTAEQRAAFPCEAGGRRCRGLRRARSERRARRAPRQGQSRPVAEYRPFTAMSASSSHSAAMARAGSRTTAPSASDGRSRLK
jgi:hypothetical protein